ncbi:MAG: helix-turn-helix domain-containing protein [Vogesella sp.]|jgi:AraC-like DNA-binding protein|uniref:AraC family transcriptional regulator n=1 Tax=Vogesella sp. TaxID=1904252 RepID=UPI003F2A10E2
MTTAASTIRYWQTPLLPGVELCRARHLDFSYGRHVHLDYHIGLVQFGGQRFIHKGNSHALVAGTLSTVNPDEVHDGLSLLPEGYEVRVFSLPPAQLAALLPQAENRFFATPLLARPDLYAGFARLHTWLEQPATDPLQAEEEALRLLATLFSLPGQPHSLSTPQLQQLRDYLMAQLDARHTLEDLATQLGLSRFAFLRQFKQRTGITPYAWLKRLRLEQGKKLLASGLPVSEVALAVGFFDQSHFHHGFRLAYGLTPAQFRQQMTGSRP